MQNIYWIWSVVKLQNHIFMELKSAAAPQHLIGNYLFQCSSRSGCKLKLALNMSPPPFESPNASDYSKWQSSGSFPNMTSVRIEIIPSTQQRQHCQPKSEPWTLEVGIDNNMLHYSEIIFDARQICWYSIGNTNMLLHWEWFFFLFGGAITNLISHQQFGYAGSKVVWAQTLEHQIFSSLLIDLAFYLLHFRTFFLSICQQSFPLAISPSWNILLVINSGLDESKMVWSQKHFFMGFGPHTFVVTSSTSSDMCIEYEFLL